MSGRFPRALAWPIFVLSESMFVAGMVMIVADPAPTRATWDSGGLGFSLLYGGGILAFSVVGALLASRRSENPVGWILLAIGFAWNLDAFLGVYATFGHAGGVGTLPGAVFAAGLQTWLWIPPIGLSGTFLILLFPDGHLPSPRWRWVGQLSAFALVVSAAAVLFTPGSMASNGYPGSDNPFGISSLGAVLESLQLVILLIPVCIVLSAVSVIGRFRRSEGVERLQLKWLTAAGAIVAAIFLFVLPASMFLGWGEASTPLWLRISEDVALLSFGLIPIAIGFALFRYRLYDIDLVISKTIVFGALAAFITVVYVGIVVGIGQLVGVGEGGAGLNIAATIAVALAFQPVRDRVRRLANRLVYGERATPYEVMADLGRHMSGTLEAERAMPEIAEAAARGIGAACARVLLSLPGGAERVAVAPADAPVPEVWTATVEVHHQGQTIGEISVAKAPGDPLLPAERSLLDDLAGQAGLALHNVALNDELGARAQDLATTANELQESRKRIVAVRDQQRRGLEREIREGPRAGLERIGTGLDEAADLAPTNPDRSEGMLDELGTQANDTLGHLRELARGIFPPLLADKGLVAALEAHLRKVEAPATLEVDPSIADVRFDDEIEACVYFCCLQAVQNALRHAEATAIVVELRASGEALEFAVRDDGRGFDPSVTSEGAGAAIMRDRIDALDGTLAVESEPGSGTIVRGSVPARSVSAVG